MSEAPTRVIDNLSIEDLGQLRKETYESIRDTEMKMSALKELLSKCQMSQNAIDLYSQRKEGDELMIPMTESIYVPAKILKPNEILMEIGTGYYIEGDGKSGVEFMERKIEGLRVAMRETQGMLEKLSQNLQTITNQMSLKASAAQSKASS